MPACPLASHCGRRGTAVPLALDMLSRREWVKLFVLGTAAACGAGAWKGTLLADISPGTSPANILTFKLSDYPALQADYGSVRFSVFGELPDGVVTVTRAPGNVFYAMSATCTHQGCVVDAYDHSPESQAMICQCHVSVYDIQGHLLYGPDQGQGQGDLKRYNTDFANGVLRVEVPGMNLGIKLNSFALAAFNPDTGAKRIQISFPVRAGAKYRILHTANLQTPPAPVAFALTANGNPNQIEWQAVSSGTRNVWIASTAVRGFYFAELYVGPYTP